MEYEWLVGTKHLLTMLNHLIKVRNIGKVRKKTEAQSKYMHMDLVKGDTNHVHKGQ